MTHTIGEYGTNSRIYFFPGQLFDFALLNRNSFALKLYKKLGRMPAYTCKYMYP